MVYISDPATLEVTTSIVFEGVPISVDYSKFLLVGLRNGHIVECDITKNAKETIMHSHHDGEIWGLAVLEEKTMFVTSCDDNKLLMFDFDKRKCVYRGLVSPQKTEETKDTVELKKKANMMKRGGASTLSHEPPEN
jgi:hypothetical protein